MACAAVGFVWMSSWHLETLEHASATIPLVICGFGFGLALAPVNAAVLAATDDDVHGLATATRRGRPDGRHARRHLGPDHDRAAPLLRRAADMPGVREVCDGKSRCKEFTLLLKEAGIAQEHTVFLGAAVCAVIAGLLALVLFRTAATRALDAGTLARRSQLSRLLISTRLPSGSLT